MKKFTAIYKRFTGTIWKDFNTKEDAVNFITSIPDIEGYPVCVIEREKTYPDEIVWKREGDFTYEYICKVIQSYKELKKLQETL